MDAMTDSLRSTLRDTSLENMAHTIVNAPFKHRLDMVKFGIGIIVFLVADKENKIIYRIALSRTELAEGTVKMSQKKFEEIKIPLDDDENIIARVIRRGKPQMTEDWRYLFTPALSPEQARINQAGGGIACSFVYPLEFGEAGGAVIFSYYKFPEKIGKPEKEFMATYSRIVSETLTQKKCNPASFGIDN